ncbi:MAG: hypothetical protein LBG11_03825 [Bifidobacteriaceae bacterium]|nr:hypothetical protein [Bifidobacteriaceae bacterium]
MNEYRHGDGAGPLVRDLTSLGPASNAGRELIVTLIVAVVFGAILYRLGANTKTLAVTALVGIYMATRWVIGVRRWRKGARWER